MSVRASAPIERRRLPPLPMMMRFWPSRSTKISAEICSTSSAGGELLDLHGDGVGQLFTELAHDLLAHHLRRHEALAAIGDLVFRETSAPTPAAAREYSAPVPRCCARLSAEMGTIALNSACSDRNCRCGSRSPLLSSRSTLLTARITGHGAGHAPAPAPTRPRRSRGTVHHHDHHVDVGNGRMLAARFI